MDEIDIENWNIQQLTSDNLIKWTFCCDEIRTKWENMRAYGNPCYAML